MNGVTLESTNPPSERVITKGSKCLTRFDVIWAAIACTALPVSLIWDFSWESSIGVDQFWSPPHVATHVAVWLCGILALRLIGGFSLARQRGEAVPGVDIGPCSGPSGAWLLLWSVLLFEATIPLDIWWQRAYGLGAGLWPPPQILKTVAFFGMLFSCLLLAVAHQNQAKSSPSSSHSSIFDSIAVPWLGGAFLALCALILVMLNYPNRQHTSAFYLVSCGVYPAVLLMCAGASGLRWGATATSAAYLAAAGATVWILPLFPAHPLTPPIHNPITRMLPPPFPLLLILPSIGLDLLHCRLAQSRPADGTLPLSLSAGTIFVALFVPVQWFFSQFLLSPAADNWFFAGGGRHWPYFLKIDQSRVMFWNNARDAVSIETFVLAAALASASACLGLMTGRWVRKVQR